ncbi:hypothetical protein Tco_0843851, partial [Tanacetum coccineum]
PARSVVLREPNSGKYQPLPEVQGKGKEKVVDEQAAHDLLTLQTPTKKSLDAELPLTDSETKLDEEVPVINVGDQDEGQAGPNPGKQDEAQARPNPDIQDEGQAGSNPGDVVESQPQPRWEEPRATDASSQQKPDKWMEEFTTNAYANVQENLKTGTAEQFGHVSVPIHQDTSLVPSMTIRVIDLTTMQSDSPLPTSTATTSIITTTSLTPPPQLRQSIADPILVSRIGELEQHMADLIQNNLALEERLDKQGTQLYNLENLNIPHKVSQAVDEIVTDAVDWAMQAPLRARFRDLPTVDMKEILQQRMFEDNSYKAHEVHNDLKEAHKKKRKKCAALRTPFGSPPSPPPPPPPPAGASGAPGISGTSGSSQLPPPPPPPSTGASGSAQQAGSEAPSSSKPAASTHQSMAWTTSDTRFESTDFMAAQELSPIDSLMQDDSIPDEKVYLSDDEDFEMITYQRLTRDKTGGNHYLKRIDQRLLNLLGPFLLLMDPSPIIFWFRQTDAIYASQAMDPKLGDSTMGYEFKHDYTIIKSPRAVVFLVDNNDRKIMRFNEIYKFSDGTLTRILEALDYRVKEFKVKQLNPGMNTRFWTEKDMTRIKKFIAAIKRRLKMKRIYRNLECFVGGRIRDIDYRLLQRT